MRRLLYALLILLALALPVAAQEPVATQAATEDFAWQDYRDPATDRPQGNPIADGVGFVLKLGLVIGLIYGVAYLYRKGLLPRTLVGGVGFSADGGTRLKLLETMPLRGAQSLHVVEVGDRLLVLGSNGKETLVKLAELPRGGFDRVVQEAEGAERFFSDELDSTIRRVMRPGGGTV